MNYSQKGLAQFLIPRGHTVKLFEVVEASFDLLASRVEVCIIVYGRCPVALWGYDRHEVMRDEGLAAAVAVLPLVHHRLRAWRRRRPRRRHGRQDGTLLTVPCREDDRDAGALVATARLAVGGPTAPSAAQSLCGLAPGFLNAPAAG
jgi:hypothetical protein